MELLEVNQSYRLFTKNDRGVGAVTYHKDESTEDIVFRPFFRKAGDPWIGALYDSIEKDGWKTSRELFGRYLDDPDFKIGCPSISFVAKPDIKVPEWIGTELVVLAEFDNDGSMTCRWATDKTGVFLITDCEYEGDINIQETSAYAKKKVKEEAERIEFYLNMMPPPPLLEYRSEDDEEDPF